MPILRNVHDIVNYHKNSFPLFEPLKESRIEMPNTPNSNPSSTKKRKLAAEPNNASSSTFPLEFKSTERSGDNVEALNNKLYREYCAVMNDADLSTEDVISELESRITTCISSRYYPASSIQCMGIDAIRQLLFNSKVSLQPIKLDLQALKSFSSQIAELFKHCTAMVHFEMISLKGRVFICS